MNWDEKRIVLAIARSCEGCCYRMKRSVDRYDSNLNSFAEAYKDLKRYQEMLELHFSDRLLKQPAVLGGLSPQSQQRLWGFFDTNNPTKIVDLRLRSNPLQTMWICPYGLIPYKLCGLGPEVQSHNFYKVIKLCFSLKNYNVKKC